MEQNNLFDAIIIGFGKGGKTLAVALGNAGLSTLMIERSSKMYGGTCINVGCIPTKFLAHKSSEAVHIRSFSEKKAYYQQVIEQELALTKELRIKNLAKLENTPNVTVVTGSAKLRSATQVEVETNDGTQVFEGKRIFLNTGSVPMIPAIEGIADNRLVLTSEALLKHTTLPRSLIIIGGGYIGVEFASIYANFGSKVTVLQKDSLFLPREDREIANAVYESLQSRGIEILMDTDVQSLAEKDGKAIVKTMRKNEQKSFEADVVLIATGRKPNTQGLGLDRAGVELTDRGGVITDERLRTTAPNIYAMGDAVGGLQFTYISLDDFRIVRSAVLGNGSYTRKDRGVVPYSVFIHPPFSRVGLSEEEAIAKGYSVKVVRVPASAIPKARVMEQPTGLLKAIVDEKSGLILGAHLFCEESHEMINTVKLAIDAKLPYTALRDMIFTHPTMTESFNDLFNV